MIDLTCTATAKSDEGNLSRDLAALLLTPSDASIVYYPHQASQTVDLT